MSFLCQNDSNIVFFLDMVSHQVIREYMVHILFGMAFTLSLEWAIYLWYQWRGWLGNCGWLEKSEISVKMAATCILESFMYLVKPFQHF